MKCEKCNEREANFYYTATINGKTTQRHLCTECAREEGFGEFMDWNDEELFSPMKMFNDFWNEPFSLIDDFFGGRRRLLSPAITLPRFHIVLDEPSAQTEAEESSKDIPQDAGEEIRSRRELSALKHQLKAAVKAEDFEKAIELRDKIKEMEKKD